jgi:hypothetical protein
MSINKHTSRMELFILAVSLTLAGIFFTKLPPKEGFEEQARGRRRSGMVLVEVVNASPFQTASLQKPLSGFAPQTRLGFTSGDQWEPAIAVDRYGHIYVLYPQYLGVPGCPECYSPTMILQTSSDHGATWDSPRVIFPDGETTGQWDAQIVVDPIDGQSVFASWLQNGKSDTVVARSTDFGVTWSVVVANHTNAGTDKPILAVRGQDVYVAYNHAQKIWVSSSHDGGATFASVNIKKTGVLGWALAGGGTVDPDGNVYISWAGYEQNGSAKGPVNLFISKSTDGGSTWTNTVIDISGSPPDCSEFSCGWAYLGAQITIDSDEAGTLYALWNAGERGQDKAPERVYFARSTDQGASWSEKEDVSAAPVGTNHAFPAIAAGSPGDVRISWMDDRMVLWNTYSRSSADSGETWSAEMDLSTFVSGYDYIFPDGFRFPFGDYFEMDIDDLGNTHAVWGEGYSYDTPGSIWYTTGR